MAPTTQIAATPVVPTMKPLDRVKLFWASRTRQQRLYLGAGLVLTLGVVAFLTQMILTPTYKPLLSALEPADAQTVSTQLAAKKIPYELSPDGTAILVPADQLEAARLEVSSHESTHSGRMGFEIFDKVSWGQTEFDERVNYQRALEGELERTIQTMSHVKTARVHLVMASDSVFSDRERSAKASVTLHLKRGSLSREELGAITRLVAGAVDELKPSDVAVIDADSNQSLGSASNAHGSADDEVEQSLNRRLVATLAPVVGADHVHASVNVEYESGSSEENQERYDPAVSVPLAVQRTEENVASGAGVGGIPGTSSNVAAPKPPTATASAAANPRDPSQSSKSESANYGVNKTTRHIVEPAGRIRRLTAAVLVDDVPDHHQEKGHWVTTYRKRSPEEVKIIADLAQAAVGYNSARGDVMSVQNLSFEHTPQEDVPPANFLERTRRALNDYAAVLRFAVLLLLFGLVYLFMIRPIQKRALAAPEATAPPPLIPELTNGGREAAALVAERALILRKQISEFVLSEPESSAVAVRAWLREGTK